jgi:hypothetical protein
VNTLSVKEAHQLASRIEQQSRTTQPRCNMQNWGGLIPTKFHRCCNMSQQYRTVYFKSRGAPTPDRNVMEHDEKKKKDKMVDLERGKEECYKCGGHGHYAVVCPT